MFESWKKQNFLTAAGVACLLGVMLAQMYFSVRLESITWDEDDHIFAGYRQWKSGDFGLNPEHPPLVKYIATLPLLGMPLKAPTLQNRDFKREAFLDGKDFLFRNDADAILIRARMAAATFAVLMALLVFAAAREMFGTGAAFIALALMTFDPNLLAHGARVATDVGVSCFLFASVYAFYRYAKKPSAARLAVTGLAAGLALGAKHTGIFIFPMLLLLALCELARGQNEAATTDGRGKKTLRLGGSLIAIGVIAVTLLWALYGFRYSARPEGLRMNPPLAEFIQPLRPHEAQLLNGFADRRILPESYLYGLADVRKMGDWYPTYFFGRVYPHGLWMYFPAAFAIKSTLAFLLMLVLTIAAIAMRKLKCWREILFLLIPPAFYMLVAMNARINIGLRHILPVYSFLIVLIGGGARALIRQNRRWTYAIAALLLFHAVSSALAFPTYMAYANELWGGPSSTYKYLSDSNTDWAQQLKAVKTYLDQRGVKNCWFAYFAEGVVDTRYYGIPCKPLITADSMWMEEEIEVPPEIDGPVLISAGTLSGFEFGSDALNPYLAFSRLRPTAVIQHGVFVYEGHFAVTMASALSYAQKAGSLRRTGKLEESLAAAQKAVAADPNCIGAQMALGDSLRRLNRAEDARGAYQRALEQAKLLEPGAKEGPISEIERKLFER